MVSRIAFFKFFALVASFGAASSAKTCPGTAKYTITFYSKWSNTTHPNAYPVGGGQFSPLIGCSHGSNYTIFSSSIKATPGVKNVAETGNPITLANEIDNQIQNAKTAWERFQAAGPFAPPNQTSALEFQVTSDFPRVSAISMIFPSPDWFIGIQSYNLCGADGRWTESYNMTDLQPWDAGTDSGTEFDDNDPTDPTVNIFQITKDMNTPFMGAESIPSLGRIMLRRIDEPSPTSCSGEAKYHLKFDALWSKSTHPTDFPSDPHFSPLIGATHKYTYKFWSEFVRASPGVKEVAEKGKPGILETEIKSKMSEYVYKVIKTGGPIDSPGTETVDITVKDGYSMLSIISMIAPSPDWFVGVDSLNLCENDGKWKDDLSVNLVAWDAGTDSGTKFTSGNDPTDPVDVVRQITKDSDTVLKGSMTIPFFGKFTLTRYDSDSMPTTAPTTKTNSATVSTAQLAFISISLFQVAALRVIL